MAVMPQLSATDVTQMVKFAIASPHKFVWFNYDEEADVLYVNFKKPAVATDSELTDDDILVRYDGEEIIGFTILHAKERGN